MSPSHANNNRIAGILYFLGNTDSRPHSGFLGLTDDLLSRKCVIVTSDDVFSSAEPEIGRGFRTTHFDGTEKSALLAVRLVVEEPSPPEAPLSNDSPKDNSPNDGNLNQLAYEQSALSARRHSNQAVVLIVGQSGHGKSTTINRLVGRNVLEMGRCTTGSTTKVSL